MALQETIFDRLLLEFENALAAFWMGSLDLRRLRTTPSWPRLLRLCDQALTMILGQVRAEIEAQLPHRQEDIAALEAEVSSARAELAKAVALSDDVPELVVELRQRAARIQNLEAQLIAARRTPAELTALIARVEENVRTNVRVLRKALTDQADLREVFQAMFPSGLKFEVARTPNDSRQA